MRSRPAAVLFDLDGTLLDTAPDMVASLNQLLDESAAPPVPYAVARAQVSNGAAGLLRIGFAGFDAARDQALLQRYLQIYAARLCAETRLFPGLGGLLGLLDQAAIPWGIVTNKPRYLTEPLLAGLGLLARSACVVSGDTLPERKPHPRPVLHALEQIRAVPGQSFYVGDAARDIHAGNAAGTITVAVRYGYIEPGQDPANWGASHVVDAPDDLTELLTVSY